MRLIIYSTDYHLAEKIHEEQIRNRDTETKILQIDNLNSQDLLEAEYVYIDWEIRDTILKYYGEILADKPISFYNALFISDIDNCENMMTVQHDALLRKDWKLCKSINEFLEYGDLIRKRTILRCHPCKLQIESTDLCNARCIMCSHAYSQGTGADLFKSNLIQQLQDIFPYVREVVLHGNGEPFLKKEIVTYLKQLAQYDIRFISSTNLSVISDELLEMFENHFTELNVSCDGHTKELYESIRCGLDFDYFISNVKKVREACKSLNMKLDVVVMRQNIPYMEDIVSFAAELGFNEVVFNMLCVDKKNDNLDDSPLLYADEYRKNILKAKECGKNCDIRVTGFDIGISDGEQKKTNCHIGERTVGNTGICDWLVESPYINLQGQVGICCINQMAIMGNLTDDSFDNIWNGVAYQDIRGRFYNGEIPDICLGCDFLLQDRLKHLYVCKNENLTLKLERELHING